MAITNSLKVVRNEDEVLSHIENRSTDEVLAEIQVYATYLAQDGWSFSPEFNVWSRDNETVRLEWGW